MQSNSDNPLGSEASKSFLLENGNEIWQKEKISLESEFYPTLKITNDNVINIIDTDYHSDNTSSVIKEYRFDREGNVL